MKTILLVDDDAELRGSVCDFLTRRGHRVLEADNGHSAVALLRSETVDTLVTDLVMPEENGLDLIMELCAERPGFDIIAMSGGGGITGRFDYLPVAQLLGARAVLRKPFRLNELAHLLESAQ